MESNKPKKNIQEESSDDSLEGSGMILPGDTLVPPTRNSFADNSEMQAPRAAVDTTEEESSNNHNNSTPQHETNEKQRHSIKREGAKSSNNEESGTDSSNQMEPGAYVVPGRAIGQLPVWARARSALNRSIRHSIFSSRRHSSTAANSHSEKPVSAVLVNDEELEANIRNQIISNAVQADVVESEQPSRYNWKKISFFVPPLLIIIGTVISLSIVFTKQQADDDSIEPSIPTLMEVTERGFLRCGVKNSTGFGHRNGSFPNGFLIDLCRAIAATVFGNGSKAEFIVPTTQDRFLLLENRSLDVLISGDTITMGRDIQEATTGMGFSFSIPFLYDGLGFAGMEHFVSCADSLFTLDPCADLQICVQIGTTHYDILSLLFPARHIVEKDTLEALFEGLKRNECNVIATEHALLGGYNGNYTSGKTFLSKEPLGMVTRDNDHQWASIVNGVIETLLFAEAQNVTQDNAPEKMNDNSSTIDSRFWKAVENVGNYGEIYKRHLEEILPRQGLNELHGCDSNETSGLLYSFPFGEIQNDGQGPTSDGTIERIVSQGELRCGVVVRVGFAEYDEHHDQWKGLDVDYCRAVTLSIFAEDDVDSRLVVVNLPPSEKELLKYLANGTIDLLSGGNFQLEQHIFESSYDATNPSFAGFAFSTPYYYNDLFFGVLPEFQKCPGLWEIGLCSDINICVGNETIHYLHLETLVDPALIIPVDYPVNEGILRGNCSAIAGSDTDVLFNQKLAAIISEPETKEYVRSQFKDSQYSLSLVTMGDDSQWSAFVNWIVLSTIYAEEQGIHRFTANQMPLINLFGEQFERMFRDTIAFLGNYQELYARNIERYIPRQGRNLLNDGNPSFGGQHHTQLREKYVVD